MLLAASLVMLMTPGLAFFYGGLASKRNILGIMMQSFVSLGMTTVLWFLVGYSLCFSGGEGAIIGNSGQNILAWNYSNYNVWKRGNPRTRLCSLPNDVCNHYSSPDYWSICKPNHF